MKYKIKGCIICVMKEHVRKYFLETLVPGLLLSSAAGVFTGAIVFFYKYAAQQLLEHTHRIYDFVAANPIHMLWFFAALAALALLTALSIKVFPDAGGGGMAKAAGILRGLITFKWLRMLIGSIVASLLGFFAGLPLGTEGPSLQIGAAAGAGAHRLTAKKKPAWKRYIMTASTAAGFGVATAAPLAGAVFALEEIHKRFSPMLIIVAFSGTLAASATAQLLSSVFNVPYRMFDFGAFPPLVISQIWIPIIIGIGAGIATCAFNSVILITGRFFDGKLARIPTTIKFIAVFLLVGTAGLLYSDVIGGGHMLIGKIASAGIVWQSLLALFFLKLILIAISSCSGASGGLFIPMLAIGAIVGGLLAEGLVAAGMAAEYYKSVVIMSMCAFLGCSLRAPVTALVFIIEATGNFNGFLFSALAVIAAYIILEFFNISPLNDVTLDRMMQKLDSRRRYTMIDIAMQVKDGSFADGKSVRDILWPPNCIVRHLVRSERPETEKKMVKSGDKKLFSGDSLLIQAYTFDKKKTFDDLEALLGEQHYY